MMNKVPPLYEGFLSQRSIAVTALDQYNSVLENRIHYIVECMCEAFDRDFDAWYFPDAAECEVGDFDKASNGKSINICIEFSSDQKSCGSKMWDDWVILLDVDGSMIEYDLKYEFPKSWLIEDFEDKLRNGRKAYLQKLKDKKLKKKERLSQKKEEEKALLEQIKKKLTPSELRLLKKAI